MIDGIYFLTYQRLAAILEVISLSSRPRYLETKRLKEDISTVQEAVVAKRRIRLFLTFSECYELLGKFFFLLQI